MTKEELQHELRIKKRKASIMARESHLAGDIRIGQEYLARFNQLQAEARDLQQQLDSK